MGLIPADFAPVRLEKNADIIWSHAPTPSTITWRTVIELLQVLLHRDFKFR